jgi:predicted secreted hydrolase
MMSAPDRLRGPPRPIGSLRRRLDFLRLGILCLGILLLGGLHPVAAAAPQQHALRFPEDEGAHPEWKTEWWYVTGWIEDHAGHWRGFQLTFFRNRGPADASHASRFAPRQILLAHAALSDPALGRILHQERVARSGFGLAEFRIGDTGVHIDDWSLARGSAGALVAHVSTADFTLQLDLTPTQAPLLQGDRGLSRKGRDPRAFSWYYSLPQLAVAGTLALGAQPAGRVRGTAWLDHEWSNAYVGDNATGWDWTGLNFLDGSALMAFRMRGAQGQTLWSSGTWRSAAGAIQRLPNGAIEFLPGRRWTSPATGARYPIAWTLRWPGQEISLEALLDNQEMDTRASTGTAYWEGAVTALRSGSPVARGYLELTGYWKPLQF